MHEPEQLPLARLQAWFLTAMTAPGGAQRGMELAQQHHGLRQGEVLKNEGRLHIYADGYVQRLLECLQADFPVLRKTMGVNCSTFSPAPISGATRRARPPCTTWVAVLPIFWQPASRQAVASSCVFPSNWPGWKGRAARRAGRRGWKSAARPGRRTLAG